MTNYEIIFPITLLKIYDPISLDTFSFMKPCTSDYSVLYLERTFTSQTQTNI